MKALGFIETKGLVGNIDATDAMLKLLTLSSLVPTPSVPV